MAKPIIAPDCGIAPPDDGGSSNVLAFPVPAKKRGRKRCVNGSAVLPFTGAQRYTYDREALLKDAKDKMSWAALQLYRDINAGKVTGMFLVVSEGSQKEAVSAAPYGLFSRDWDFSAQYTKLIAEWAADETRGSKVAVAD